MSALPLQVAAKVNRAASPNTRKEATLSIRAGLARGEIELDRALTWSLELHEHDALELPQNGPTIAHGHGYGDSNEGAEHVSTDMVGRIVDVWRGLRHQTVQDVQEVLGDTFFVGQDREGTRRVLNEEPTDAIAQ